MLSDDLISALARYTEQLDLKKPNLNFTADALASEFSVQRNTVSHYLNIGVKNGILIKINTRPVYFLHKAAFVRNFFPLQKTQYISWKELLTEKETCTDNGQVESQVILSELSNTEDTVDVFNGMIGHNGSMRKILTEIKASVLYPDNGLPIMLHGPTGVGKSYLAKLIYQFAVEKGVISNHAPFISFNCAQYADNPELLSSNLFGHVKGAFTGAHTTTNGLLEEANGGVLFLDEVHRLSWTGQEKLFTFMDQGVYRRVGENGKWHHSNVRLIMATTETTLSAFLGTFLRRIPVCSYIPSLEERGQNEKYELICKSFLQEAQNFGRPLRLSGLVQSFLLSHIYSGNLGEVINVVKYTTALASARCHEKAEVEVEFQDLPEVIIRNARQIGNGNMLPEVVLKPEMSLHSFNRTVQIYKPSASHLLEQLLSMLEEQGWNENLSKDFKEEYDRYCNYLLYDYKPDKDAILRFVSEAIEKIFLDLERSRGVRFNKADICVVALYFYSRKIGETQFSKSHSAQYAEILALLQEKFSREGFVAELILNKIKTVLEMPKSVEDELFLLFLLAGTGMYQDKKSRRALIIAHGYSTASSIADAANQKLNTTLFDAIDVPVQDSEINMTRQLRRYLGETDFSHGLIILADADVMDCLSQLVRSFMTAPIVVICNISFQTVLQTGRLLRDTTAILEDIVPEVTEHSKIDYRIFYPRVNRQRVLLTCCTAGIGAATHLKKVLDNSIPAELEIRIVAVDYKHLKKRGKSDPFFQLYQVIGVVGTIDPGIPDIPFIGLEALMSDSSMEQLGILFNLPKNSDILQRINTQLIHNFSLPQLIENLTILDYEKVLANVEQCIAQLEMLMKTRFQNAKKIGLYLHISCLLERLVRNAPIETYQDLAHFRELHQKELDLIHRSLTSLEDIYSVEIPVSELAYIYDIVFHTS